MFLGKHALTLDKENRFIAPAAFKQELSTGAFILQGFEQNLLVFPFPSFEKLYSALSAQNLADPLARSLLRMLLGSTQELSQDANGRLSLPGELKSFAQLGTQLMVIGQGDFFEIWQPELWEKQEIDLRDAAANSARFSTLTVTTR